MSVRRNLAGILAAPLLLSACGGGDDSVADPPISSAPTSSATGTPQRESAEHFIRRWADVEQTMENTGETAEYLMLSRGCEPCRRLSSQVSGYYRDGGFVHWGGWEILSIKSYPDQPGYSFAVHSNSSPTRYRRSSGSPLEHFSGGSITYVLALKRSENSWVVTNKSELDT
jgi:hypothetical protein